MKTGSNCVETNPSLCRPGQALRVQGGGGFRFHDNQHKNIVGLSALNTGRIYPARNIPGTLFCRRLRRPRGHSAAGRIMLMKNSNRSRDFPACSAVPHQTASLGTCEDIDVNEKRRLYIKVAVVYMLD
jgi:hypothetical protein